MSPRDLLARRLSQVLASEPFSLDMPAADLARSVGVAKDPTHGDYAFACFPLAKALRKSPVQIASDLAPALRDALEDSDPFRSIEATQAYINVRIDAGKHAQRLVGEILAGDRLAPRPVTDTQVMIEYSQPNTHKGFHVGHIRNVALGHSLVNQFRFHGYDVVAANYIGDEGTHIAKCLWYLRNHFEGETPDTNRGEFLGQQYAAAVELLDLSVLTRVPHPNVFSARVVRSEPHPTNDKWQVVDVDTGDAHPTVVTAGRGFNVGDVVPYAAVGSVMNDRPVGVVDKQGVQSTGMICSSAEIGLGDGRDIHVLDPTTPLGVPLTEWFRIDGQRDAEVSVEALVASRNAEVRAVLQQLEAHEPEMHALWKETRQWSLDAFAEVYAWLGAPFDHDFFESEVSATSKQIILEAYEKGLLEKSQGAIGARLDKLPFFLLLKSDGTGLYSTKDIALAQRKFDQFHIDRSIYVVDQSQSLHFQQVFATLELLGYDKARDCYHLAYGMVVLPDGKMSSRKGNVILFSRLRESVLQAIHAKYMDKFRGDWPDEEIEDTAKKVAIATVYYGMLNQGTLKDIVFDLEAWTEPTGQTGPYMLYAVARVRSILRKAGAERGAPDWNALGHETESELLLLMERFDEVALQALQDYRPQALCIYAYDLARAMNRHNKHCPVLKAETPGLREARLQLIDAAAQVLDRTLHLLGIDTVERM